MCFTSGYHVFQVAWGKNTSESIARGNCAQGCRFYLHCGFSLEYLMHGRGYPEVKREVLLAGSWRPLSCFFFQKNGRSSAHSLLLWFLILCPFCGILSLVLNMNQWEKNTMGATWWMQKNLTTELRHWMKNYNWILPQGIKPLKNVSL